VFLVDSKNWRGRLLLGRDGTLWYGGYPVTVTLATIGFEAAAIATTLSVPSRIIQPMMVLHGSTIPWGEQYLGGIAILPAGRLAASLLALPSRLTDQQVAERTITRLRPAT
jgi:hypothetical protein